ncbi:MAG: N-acetylmuramoyl-L-alanine amidase, partial [Cellulomonas sp.]
MSDPRRAAAVLLSAALATSLVVLPGSAATAATEADGSVDVTELDLVGVRSDLVSSLPDPEDVPLAEEAEPATASQDATVDDAGSTASSGEGGRVVRTALAATPTEDDEPRTSATDAEPTAPAAPSEPAASPSAAPRGAAPSPDVTAPSPSPSPTAGAGTTPTPDVLTAPLDTAPFTVLGLTWQDEPGLDDVVVRYRVREAGSWSEWVGVSASDIAPDLGTPDAEAGARDGTDAVVTAGADGLQVWAEAGSGRVTGLKAVLVDPGEATVDARATVGASTGAGRASDAAVRDAAVLAAAAPARPAIISRAGWGADESLRGCTPDYSNSMVSAAVHHTASANDYSADAVAGIIRGIYSYHTRPEAAGGRGWCDIGYNFLVDRFGRTFEGRAGGVTSTVVGVHTGGFNSRTIGVSAIGNFATTGAPDAMVEAISQLIAWKFSVHRITAGTNVTMVSGGGASRFPAGTVVSFPTIYAHRDAATTTCPGQYLYDRLAQIRARVAQLANAAVAASPRGVVDAYQGGSGITVRGWAFDPETDASLTIRVSVGGKVSDIAADRARPDVAAAYGVGSRHGFDARITAANGRHVVCVTAVNRGSGADVVLGCALVTVSNAAPVGVLDAISTTPTTISLRGWALDPDTTAPIGVHVYV